MAASSGAEHPHRIRDLNDAFRRSFSGGRVVMSAGFAALPSVARAALLAAVRSFDRFDADYDPHGEHDFGAFELAGYRCFLRIDCYDRGLRVASPQPDRPGRHDPCADRHARRGVLWLPALTP